MTARVRAKKLQKQQLVTLPRLMAQALSHSSSSSKWLWSALARVSCSSSLSWTPHHHTTVALARCDAGSTWLVPAA